MDTLQRSIAAIALGSAVAVLAAGCGSGHSNAAVTSELATVTVTQTETTAPTTPAAAVTTASSAPTTPACVTAHLTVTLGQGNGAAGHTIYPLRFTNTGSDACILGGFPGVSYVTGSTTHTQVGAAAIRNGAAGGAVTLPPNAAATAQVSVGSTGPYPPATCRAIKATGLLVYPPGSTQAVFVAQPLTVCSNTTLTTLSVETITAG
jgi:hypothetical protein